MKHETSKISQEIFEKISSEQQETIRIKQSKTPKIIDETLAKMAKVDQWTGIQMRLPYEIQMK